MSAKPSECWASDATAKALRIEISEKRTLLLPFDQFLYAESENVDDEQNLRLFFATHEVLIRGNCLRRLETALQRMELAFVSCSSRSAQKMDSDTQAQVREIVVTESAARETPNSAP
jgi:hypothetical protein